MFTKSDFIWSSCLKSVISSRTVTVPSTLVSGPQGSGHSAEDGFPGRDLLDRGSFSNLSGDDPLEGSEKSLFLSESRRQGRGFHLPGDLQRRMSGGCEERSSFRLVTMTPLPIQWDDGGDPGLLEGKIVKIFAPLLFQKDVPFSSSRRCLPLFGTTIQERSSLKRLWL